VPAVFRCIEEIDRKAFPRQGLARCLAEFGIVFDEEQFHARAADDFGWNHEDRTACACEVA